MNSGSTDEQLLAALVDNGYYVDTEEAREAIDNLEYSYDCVITNPASEEEQRMYGKGLWGVRNSGGSIFLHELPFGGWEDLDIDVPDYDLDSAMRLHDAGDYDELSDYPTADEMVNDSEYYEEGEEDQAMWEDDSTVYLDDLADEPLDEPAVDQTRYKGYLISGTPKSGYVCVAPYGAFSPQSYKTIDEAKAAIDADYNIGRQEHYPR